MLVCWEYRTFQSGTPNVLPPTDKLKIKEEWLLEFIHFRRKYIERMVCTPFLKPNDFLSIQIIEKTCKKPHHLNPEKAKQFFLCLILFFIQIIQ